MDLFVIHESSDKGENNVPFSDIENLAETKNWVILFLKGSMTVAPDKKGFTSGNADECINYLKARINRKGMDK